MVIIVILTLLTFGIVTIAVVSGYYWASAESPVAQRLKTLVPELGSQAKAKGKGPSLGARLLALLGTYSFGGRENSLGQRLSYAGIRGPRAVVLFLGIRTLFSFGPALVVLVPRISSGKPLGYALLMPAHVGACGHVLMNLWLRVRLTRRAQELTSALPDTLDLMVTCLEAGLGLNAAIARIGEERSGREDALGREFAQVAFELRSGRTREDALRGLGDRNGVEDLKALSGLIIQSDRLGASMAQTLRSHADLLRTKRLRLAHTHWARLRGLLGTKRLDPGHGLWLRPCRQIHMFGMRYAVDAVFLDEHQRVVRALSELSPWRVSPRVADAESVLELPAGTVARTWLAQGAQVGIEGGPVVSRGGAGGRGGTAVAVAAVYLGRSFGLLAANRGVQLGGAYRLVRHPMYGAHALGYLGYVLTYPSAANVMVVGATLLLLNARAVAEERILARDPA